MSVRSSQVPSSARRPRQRATTAATEDGSQPPTSSTLPDFEPPVAPLNPAARQALTALLGSNTLTHLNNHLQSAGEHLTNNAGLVNDRLTDARLRLEKRVANGAGDGGERGEVEELERQVAELTGRMEGKMREVVDAEVKVGDLGDVVKELEKECEDEAKKRERRRQADDEDGDENEDEDMQDAEEEDDMKVQSCPSQRLQEKLAEKKARWDGLSLTERYTTNNAYKGFYTTAYEAKFPGDNIPPIPHASTWFDPPNLPQTIPNALPNRTTTTNETQSQSQQEQEATTQLPTQPAFAPLDQDVDVTIASERIATKCPLTLLPFQHPVTSTKCPHSFERHAITDMINRSKDIRRADGSQINPRNRRGAAAAGEERVHFVRCPVCEVDLSLADLRDDPVLMRRVRRAEEVEAAEREEEDFGIGEDGGGGASGSGRGRNGITVDDIEDGEDSVNAGVGSMKRERDAVEEERRLRIKKEMSRDVSIVPNTQYTAVDDDDDDEDDDEE